MEKPKTPSIDDRIHGISTLVHSTWTGIQSSASGFFFQRHEKDNPDERKSIHGGPGYRWVKVENTWLITNRHVLINSNNELASSITFHLREITPTGFEWIPITISGTDLQDRCLFHKSDDVDVAVIRILDLLASSIGTIAKTRKVMSYTSVTEADFPHANKISVEIGDDAMIIGYPRGFYDGYSKYPIAKSGIIASRWGAPFNGKPYFLIDAKLFPGSSGSIVISRPTEFQFRDGNMLKSSSGAKEFALLGVFSGEPFRISRPVETDGFTIISKEGYNVGIVWYYYLIPQIIDDGKKH